ncbi:hypothetical protein HanHA300_Chr11g0414691 [Helianthus annuus]|nr:hypothetical protein HanHA300_Chr11g0414691 [Helianthus annuus]
MKGGARRKTLTSDLHPPLNPLHSEIVDHQVNDNNNGGENGANDHEKEENEDAADEQERPKLAEGFYEIEVIRKKRIRKLTYGVFLWWIACGKGCEAVPYKMFLKKEEVFLLFMEYEVNDGVDLWKFLGFEKLFC